MKTLAFVLAFVLALLWPAQDVLAQTRGVALVIGNGGYADKPLANPVNDAQDMAAALRDAGFDVLLRLNVDETAMKIALADFEDKLRAGKGVGLFYFAGHGVQTARGRNYLLPVGRGYQRERDVELFGVPADAVLASMEQRGSSLNIVILDACRDAPLPQESRSAGSRGLARMDAPSGSLIAFATASGRTASDNAGRRNGLYTQHLLKSIRTPGLRLEDVFKEVGRAVERDSNGLQSPEEFMKLRDPTPFCFFAGAGCGLPFALQGAGLPAAAAPAAAVTAAALPPAAVPVATPAAIVAPALPRPEPIVSTNGATKARTLFEASAAALGPAAIATLDALTAQLPGLSVQVVFAIGYADPGEASGAEAQRLSLARAEAVKEYLVARGIDANRIYTDGKGSALMATDGRSTETRAANRRVEVEVLGARR